MTRQKIFVYDSTLRDGTQGEGVSFSIDDKLKIASALDKLGVDYVEAGNPGSNPKDLEFFRRAAARGLSHAKIAAFGSTHRIGMRVDDDPNIQALLSAATPVVTIFGKAWDLHVREVLHAELSDNIEIICSTIAYLFAQGKEVIFDAEHFYDGYKNNPKYAMLVLKTAAEAGADTLCLCDTNGSAFPDEIAQITKTVSEAFPHARIGVHCHNDVGMAVAGTVMGVLSGATLLQGTMNGFGERCGNANLCSIIPNLQLKRGYLCIPPEKLETLKTTSRLVYELANIVPDERKPYVGNMAFAHKGGMHIDAVHKNPVTFEHIEPELVGNRRRFLMSEMSGRSTVLSTIRKVDETVRRDSKETTEILAELKRRESEGYQFEAAESSFELLIRKMLGKYSPFFSLEQFKVLSISPNPANYTCSAMIKINVDGKSEMTAAEGDGPVNALDKALRKALERFYPEIGKMRLIDFKVRVLDGKDAATASRTRVLIESTDGVENWSTVGVSRDIVEASWMALVDSVEYMLQRTRGAAAFAEKK